MSVPICNSNKIYSLSSSGGATVTVLERRGHFIFKSPFSKLAAKEQARLRKQFTLIWAEANRKNNK